MANSHKRIVKTLKPLTEVEAIADPQTDLKPLRTGHYQFEFRRIRSASAMLAIALTGMDPFASASSGEDQGADDMLVRALDLSVNDYIVRPIDTNELFKAKKLQREPE